MEEKLHKLAFWNALMGWFLLISGAISAVLGLFAFVVGAIPGLVTLYLGWKLLQASKEAKKIANQLKEGEISYEELMEHYLTFFKVQGIVSIVGVIIYLLLFAIMGAGMVALL